MKLAVKSSMLHITAAVAGIASALFDAGKMHFSSNLSSTYASREMPHCKKDTSKAILCSPSMLPELPLHMAALLVAFERFWSPSNHYHAAMEGIF